MARRRRHIKTKYDRDPFANTYIRCNWCGSWTDASFGNSCCWNCGCDFDDTETTQRGIYPPGWERPEDEDE